MSDYRRRDDGRGMLVGGLIVTGIGVLFLLNNLGIIPDLETLWPVIPIIVGLALILGSVSRMRGTGGNAE